MLSTDIANKILKENFEDEKQRQKDVAKEISSDDLDAPDKDTGKETLTDEGEDDEEKIKPKPKPESSEEESDDGDFEVEAAKSAPTVVTFDSIKKQINNLRAGKSLKDEDVSGQLKDYFDKLGRAEETSLYVFLSSLAAILTGGTPGEEAPRPESMGVNIDIKKKQSAAPGKSDIPGVTPAGEQAPIIVGEVADTNNFKMMLLETLTANDQHRCQNGKLVGFGTEKCMSDLGSRIEDATFTRDNCAGGSADRASLNGTLKYLRQKLRAAQKVSALTGK